MTFIFKKYLKLLILPPLISNCGGGGGAAVQNFVDNVVSALDGEIIYSDIKASLKTITPERNIGLYYTDKANEELYWNFRVNTEYRNNIAGQNGKNDFGFGLYVDKKF